MPATGKALPELDQESSLPPEMGNKRQPRREEEKGLVAVFSPLQSAKKQDLVRPQQLNSTNEKRTGQGDFDH